jgi:hypothetical protein
VDKYGNTWSKRTIQAGGNITSETAVKAPEVEATYITMVNTGVVTTISGSGNHFVMGTFFVVCEF